MSRGNWCKGLMMATKNQGPPASFLGQAFLIKQDKRTHLGLKLQESSSFSASRPCLEHCRNHRPTLNTHHCLERVQRWERKHLLLGIPEQQVYLPKMKNGRAGITHCTGAREPSRLRWSPWTLAPPNGMGQAVAVQLWFWACSCSARAHQHGEEIYTTPWNTHPLWEGNSTQEMVPLIHTISTSRV